MISDEVRSFLQTSVRSVWSLELLLLLRRESHRCWHPDDLIRETRSSTVVVQEALAGMCQAGLLVQEADGCFRYQPAAPVLDDWVRQIESIYAQKPSLIIKTIFAAPDSKVQIFADAFKIRGSD